MSHAPTRLPAPPPFELWLVALADEVADEDADLLDDAERARAARFAFARDRGRYVAAHAALRRLLAQRTGVPAAALRLDVGAFGKPRLRDVAGCTFSLSHSGDRALVALSDTDGIGVDLEAVRALRDIDALAARCLGERERCHFESTPEPERELAFLRAWTRKEACLKALGTGLHIEPSQVDVGLDFAERRVQIAGPAGVCELAVRSLEPAPGWVGALAWIAARPKEGISGGRPRL